MLPSTEIKNKSYYQVTHIVPPGVVHKIDVSFFPDTWYLVPRTALPDPVLVSASADVDVISNGVPIQGSNPSTLPARGKVLYLYNTGAVNIIFNVTASFGYTAPVTSTPTVITETGVTGVWQILADGATITWDLSLGNGEVTLDGNRTMANPSNVVAGKQYYLLVKQDAVTGGRLLTWGTDFHFAGGAPPYLSFLPDEWDLLEFFADDNGYMHLQRITRDMRNTFNPISLGNLWGWYKADSIIGLSDGDAVATWADQSGNGNDLSQATANKRPLWRSTVQNNKPGLQFDGSNDNIGITATFTRPFTVYVVTATVALAGITSRRVVSMKLVSERWIQQDDSNVWNYYNGANINGSVPVIDRFLLLAIMQTASGGELWENGNSQGTNAQAAANCTVMGLGSQYDQSDNHYNGYICELLVFEVNHTLAQRIQVQEYLRGKYNLW